MKIIGRQEGSTYIVQITEDEMAQAAGFGGSHYTAWQEASRTARESGRNGEPLRTGSVIAIGVTHRHIGSLIERDAEVKKSAQTLRALADLIDRGVQGVIVAPEPPAAKDH